MMGLQAFEQKNEAIRQRFETLKQKNPEKLKQRLHLSWSNWRFGMESLAESVARQNAIDYISRELDFAAEVGAGYMLVGAGRCFA